MEIYGLYPESFGSNCYILISGNEGERRQAAVIDPSVKPEKIIDLVSKNNADIKYIILTHGHFDHVLSLDTLRDMTGAPALIHKCDSEMLTDGDKNAHAFFFGYDKKWRPAEKLLENGDEIALGEEVIKIISTPGHSKGSICLLSGNKLITGDTLFEAGYGRYDLYGGDVNALTASLSSLRALDGQLTIYPGHGGSTTLSRALDNVLYY